VEADIKKRITKIHTEIKSRLIQHASIEATLAKKGMILQFACQEGQDRKYLYSKDK